MGPEFSFLGNLPKLKHSRHSCSKIRRNLVFPAPTGTQPAMPDAMSIQDNASHHLHFVLQDPPVNESFSTIQAFCEIRPQECRAVIRNNQLLTVLAGRC